MKKSNFALRLQPSLLEEARRTAEEEGVALNQLINVAVAEKLSALRTQAFFRERARHANVPFICPAPVPHLSKPSWQFDRTVGCTRTVPTCLGSPD
jgi:hypothetical protein